MIVAIDTPGGNLHEQKSPANNFVSVVSKLFAGLFYSFSNAPTNLTLPQLSYQPRYEEPNVDRNFL